SPLGRFRLVAPADENQSVDLRSRSVAGVAVPREPHSDVVFHLDGGAAAGDRADVRFVFCAGQSKNHQACGMIPEQYAYFPGLIASLNGASAALLLVGRNLILRGKLAAHRACMIAAVASSTLFLACYLYFHYHVGDIRFLGDRFWHV